MDLATFCEERGEKEILPVLHLFMFLGWIILLTIVTFTSYGWWQIGKTLFSFLF